jgi:hypothetical protein
MVSPAGKRARACAEAGAEAGAGAGAGVAPSARARAGFSVRAAAGLGGAAAPVGQGEPSSSSSGGGGGIGGSWTRLSSVGTSAPRLDSGRARAAVSSESVVSAALVQETSIAKQQREQRERKQGARRDWHEMEVPEMTPELGKELRVLQLRGYMDPKRFYKSMDSKKGTKFQVGTVVDSFGAAPSSRMPKAVRRPTFVEQVLADDSIRGYARKTFGQLQRKQGSKLRFKSKKGAKR